MASPLRDLTDPAAGPHALQLLLADVERALSRGWGVPLRRHRADPVVTVAENYDRLGYPPDAVTRDARYTRYVGPDRLLRSHTSALVPPLLDRLAAAPPADVLLCCPGLVYRRDAIDRLHVGEPHQVDLWRIRSIGPGLGPADLRDMVHRVLAAALPGREHKTVPAVHPYTVGGLQIDVRGPEGWVEIGECGLASPKVLHAAGLDAAASGLAMGLGLDRLLMLRKGIDDIRLLRSPDPRVAGQLQDLEPYQPVSVMPPIRRDLSLAVEGETGTEILGDRVRAALGPDAAAVETVEVLAVTPWAEVPPPARDRLGLRHGQANVLLRIVLRSHERTLTAQEANALRDRIAAALDDGAAQRPPATDTDSQ